jgi:hypothetical protein
MSKIIVDLPNLEDISPSTALTKLTIIIIYLNSVSLSDKHIIVDFPTFLSLYPVLYFIITTT